MGLIKKSVFDIERKLKYARIVMRVLKECKLVREFIEYTTTDNYNNFLKNYIQKHKNCTDVWYDKELCGSILGCCNFCYFIKEKYGREKSHQYSPYHLLLCYLAIFDEKEYMRYASCYGSIDGACVFPQEYVNNALCGMNFDQGKCDADIVKNWLTLKETFYGDKN